MHNTSRELRKEGVGNIYTTWYLFFPPSAQRFQVFPRYLNIASHFFTLSFFPDIVGGNRPCTLGPAVAAAGACVV